MKLRVRALAMAGGIVCGTYVFLATMWIMWFRGGGSFPMLEKLYPGYAVTYLGACVGLIWGFVDGAFCGAVVAWLYNRFHKSFYNSEAST